jgi:hypothetical protein
VAYLEKKRQERERIQKRMQELSKQRDAYIAKNQKQEGPDSLDKAMLRAIREQATERGYKFKN